MSLDLHECSRCLRYLNSYSGEHLCDSCAEILGRGTHDPWWGSFASHPDRSADENRVRSQVERDLKFTIELQRAMPSARAVAATRSRRVSPSRPSGLPSLSQGEM